MLTSFTNKFQFILNSKCHSNKKYLCFCLKEAPTLSEFLFYLLAVSPSFPVLSSPIKFCCVLSCPFMSSPGLSANSCSCDAHCSSVPFAAIKPSELDHNPSITTQMPTSANHPSSLFTTSLRIFSFLIL